MIFKFYLLTTVKSFFQTRKPVRAIEFYVLSASEKLYGLRASEELLHWFSIGDVV